MEALVAGSRAGRSSRTSGTPRPTEGLLAEFAGTGWYVVVAVVAGLVLGLVAGLLLDRDEIVTLVAVVVGSALAAWLMMKVGFHFRPPDPQAIAESAKDGTELPGRLDLSGAVNLPRQRFDNEVRSPMLAFPIGAWPAWRSPCSGSRSRTDAGLTRNLGG